MLTASAAVRIDGVIVELGHGFRALDGLDATITHGSITGLIGPSGAGKTTLIRAIVGRQRLSSGHLEVLGAPAGSASLRKQLGYMTQENSVYSDLTVFQNMRYFATMRGLERRAAPAAITEILHKLDMTRQATQLVSSLSTGQKQRVSLAVALLGNPSMLVLDEPTVGLDPLLREQIWQLFYELAKGGTTLIISSHVMDEAERCQDLLLIREGRILAHGSPAALRQQTDTKTVEQSFLHLVGAAA